MHRASLVLAFGALTLLGSLARAGDPPIKEQTEFEDRLRKELGPKAGAPGAPAAPAELSDGSAGGILGQEGMKRANRAAAEILKRRMERERPNDLLLLRDAAVAEVIVVSGSYDRVQDVLRAVEVKHVVVPPHMLARLSLLPTQTLMINCPGHLPAAAIPKVRSFVERGGYLVTTDWAIDLTARAFPKTIARGGKNTENDVVPVHIHDAKEPLLAHVKVLKDDPRWWLESSSYPIHVVDRERVRVLMSSKELGRRYGESPVVVAFRAGDGKVLHMTSHFYLQQGKLFSASEKRKGSAFAAEAGLDDKDVKALAGRGVDLEGVQAGELGSAYSMQQVSTNLLVEKQKANRTLLKRYSGKVAADEVRLAPSPSAEPAQTAPTIKRDYRIEVLEREGGKARVRDLFGNEGWVPAEALR